MLRTVIERVKLHYTPFHRYVATPNLNE